jgi:hypothetical protein
MTLGFIQNIGPMEWIVILFVLACGGAVAGFVLWIVLRAAKPTAPSHLETRVARLEQQLAELQATRP